MSTSYKAVLFDIDGTLVDSNDAHAQAWVDAFAEAGVTVDPVKVRRCIGMGGDKLMPAVSGIDEASPQGTRISDRRGEIFRAKYLPALKPFPRAAELVAAVKARGLVAVAASSASRKDLHALLKVAGAEDLLDEATSSDDAEQSKPDPDIVQAALAKAGSRPEDTVMIGDTPYDVEAARRAGVDAIALRCGGWGDDDLRGAVAIYDGPSDLLNSTFAQAAAAPADAAPLRRV
jgi:HAD superfamily hydrolase (TIGR01509 family)